MGFAGRLVEVAPDVEGGQVERVLPGKLALRCLLGVKRHGDFYVLDVVVESTSGKCLKGKPGEADVLRTGNIPIFFSCKRIARWLIETLIGRKLIHFIAYQSRGRIDGIYNRLELEHLIHSRCLHLDDGLLVGGNAAADIPEVALKDAYGCTAERAALIAEGRIGGAFRGDKPRRSEKQDDSRAHDDSRQMIKNCLHIGSESGLGVQTFGTRLNVHRAGDCENEAFGHRTVCFRYTPRFAALDHVMDLSRNVKMQRIHPG